jgi:hypothetical protein
VARMRRRRAREDLKCPKCHRRFSLDMHLARHMGAVHGQRKREGKKKIVSPRRTRS